MEEETGARQIITSEYNKLRTEEYLHLRGRFYKRFPKCLESDYEFEQEIFLHFDILQAEIKRLQEENGKLLDNLLAAGFLGNGTQIIGDKRYEELITAEAELKRLNLK